VKLTDLVGSEVQFYRDMSGFSSKKFNCVSDVFGICGFSQFRQRRVGKVP